jgi:hypothetical protein
VKFPNADKPQTDGCNHRKAIRGILPKPSSVAERRILSANLGVFGVSWRNFLFFAKRELNHLILMLKKRIKFLFSREAFKYLRTYFLQALGSILVAGYFVTSLRAFLSEAIL